MGTAAIFGSALLAAVGDITAEPDGLPLGTKQVVLVLAEDWEATRGSLQLFERGAGLRPGWKAVLPREVPVLLGRSGLAWGRGLVAAPALPDRHKREGDGRTPAGIFAIGKIYGYGAELPAGARFPYHQVSRWDAWIDDPKNPLYNRHVVVDPKDVPPWFKSQKMHHGDPAYRWLVEVRHNSDPPIAGAGSAIFLHTRRGPDRRTAGCTTMAEQELLRLLRWLRPEAKPVYVILPVDEFRARRRAWRLP